MKKDDWLNKGHSILGQVAGIKIVGKDARLLNRFFAQIVRDLARKDGLKSNSSWGCFTYYTAAKPS